MRKMFENGFAEKLDISKLEVQLANMQTERLKALNTINNGFLGLKFLMGMPIKDTLILTDSVSYEEIRQVCWKQRSISIRTEKNINMQNWD